jgi:tRNA-intron endonuclease, archaea type
LEQLDLTEEQKQLLETGDFPPSKIPARLIGPKVVVFNPVFGSLLYGFGRYFGSPVGIHKPKSFIFNRPLELSLFEGLYLLKHGRIEIIAETDSSYTPEMFMQFATHKYPEFAEKYVIYEDLREKHYIPRPGQKFGADFIVYKEGPGVDHSSFCIQVLSRNNRISSIDVVRAARLATSVKKHFVLANPITKSYFQFRWFKP